ncbi:MULTISPECIES: alkaline phosphatase family protein [Salinibaculum]|uniref:alkaline phosphatase family protein n=1 Tax=Salinibaculum TaxID=2732368 RepID=UPI0030D25E95
MKTETHPDTESAPSTDSLRTLLVGLDGVCRDVLDARGDGVVPTLREILDEGTAAPLESQIPPWTPSAWPSLYTGVNPGKHGVYSFLRFDGYDWDVVNATDVGEFALWELVDRAGMTSVVVNVPVTHPPREFDGALVPGYTAPEDPECHPPGLLDDLRAELGEYRLYDDATSDATGEAAVEGYRQLTEMRGAAFRYLVDRFEPAFGFLQFQQTDTVFHEHPEEDAIVDGVFRAVDREVGRTLAACDPDVVVLASDHGIGPYGGHEFRVNSFLRDHGAVETVAGEGGMPSWDSIARNRLRGDEETGGGSALFARLTRAAARAGVTSQRIATVVRRLGIEDLVVSIAPVDAIRAGTERVDFAASTAYLRDRVELGVRLNVAGREPDGVVSEAEYEANRDELIAALSAVETPDDTPVFSDVLRREELYHGPYVEDAPDIVVVPAAFDQYISASVRAEQFGPPSEPWNHKLDGIVAVAGDVDTEADLTGAHIFDVAPTVLATLGVPVSDRMDGDPLPVVTDHDTATYEAYESRAVEESRPDVEQRLAEMGYLER